MPPFIYTFAVIVFTFVVRVESSSYVYTYDDGDDERCCLARLGEKFCLAKPLTRSLVQVNQECQRLGANDKQKNYLNKILRRLNADTSTKLPGKILIHLKNPIEKDLLNDDLVCLSSETNNHIDLEKCYVGWTMKRGQNETNDEENPTQQVEVSEPVQVHQGRGLSVRQTYELNLTDFQATTRQQRECWAWYRKHTKDILNHPTKSKKTCVPLNNQHEKCLDELYYSKTDAETLKSLPSGSKLYCENPSQQSRLLGYHRRSELCFLTHYQIYLEHKFTDFLSLADAKKNRDVLKYLANNTKLTAEFQEDCHDRNTLNQIKKSIEEEQQDDENLSSEE